MAFYKGDIGIDLGTANVLVYQRRKGIILREPSVVAYDINKDRVVAVGQAAASMIGRTPGNIVAKRPIRDGVVAAFDVAQDMLKYFVSEALNGANTGGLRVAIGVPCGVTDVEKKAIERSAEKAGIKRPFLIEEPLAAAFGSGISASDPRGRMVVDIGGGTTDVAVVSEGGIVSSGSIKIAGNTFDNNIIDYIKDKYSINIGERTAEEIKIKIGMAIPRPRSVSIQAKGLNMISGWPETINVTSDEIMHAISGSIESIADVVKRVFERTPPELCSDIREDGIMLTGGGSLLFGMDNRFEELLGIRVYIVENPLDCVAIGTGICFSCYEEREHRKKRIDRDKVPSLYGDREDFEAYQKLEFDTQDGKSAPSKKTGKQKRQGRAANQADVLRQDEMESRQDEIAQRQDEMESRQHDIAPQQGDIELQTKESQADAQIHERNRNNGFRDRVARMISDIIDD